MIHLKEMKSSIKFFCFVFICGIAVSLGAVSCKHANEYIKQTASLDSLSKALADADVLLKQTDSAKIKKDIDRVFIAQDFIKMLAKDTMSEGAKDIFKTYSSTRWQLQFFLGRRTIMDKEIQKSIAQLAHLSHDIANGLVEKDSVMTYYNFESKKASELVEAATYGLNIVKIQVPLNEMVAPQADSLVNRLKKHKKI